MFGLGIGSRIRIGTDVAGGPVLQVCQNFYCGIGIRLGVESRGEVDIELDVDAGWGVPALRESSSAPSDRTNVLIF